MTVPPSPGLLGAGSDFLRLLLGMRLLANCIITLLFHLPLPLVAATHTAVVLLTRNNAAYCSAEVGGWGEGREQGQGPGQTSSCMHPHQAAIRGGIPSRAPFTPSDPAPACLAHPPPPAL